MTEDDTFRALKRTPVNEIWPQAIFIFYSSPAGTMEESVNRFLRLHGWTWKELMVEKFAVKAGSESLPDILSP